MRFLKYINILSLDVVLAAWSIAFMLSNLHEIHMHWSVYCSLSVTVWLIYTFDHLMDARSIGANLVSDRHKFHKDHFNTILYGWSIILIASVFVLLPRLPHKTILYGVFGSALVVGHFVLVKLLGSKLSVWIQKEFGVALVFSLGVFTGPLSYMKEFDVNLLAEFTRLFLVAFFNLIMFSLFDLGIDKTQNQTSLTRYLGVKRTYILLLSIDFIFVLTLFFCHFDSSLYFYSSVLFFYNILVLIKFNSKSVKQYRLIGDSILIGAALVPFL